MSAPVMVLNTNTKRETGKGAQAANITAAKAVADVVRTTLGPRSMLKMLLDPMGGIVITNDGNAILREIDVSHPAAKSMIELSRAQDEEVGDGTTSVIILAGEMLVVAEPFLSRGIHPTVIVRAYQRALQAALKVCDELAIEIDVTNRAEMTSLVKSCIGTKFASRYGDMLCGLALDAVTTVAVDQGPGSKVIDLKRFARVEKLPGGDLSECRVIDGIMINKDVTHSRMRRRIENPRIIQLDCPLEYKKAESATNVEMMGEDDFEAMLMREEKWIRDTCEAIIRFRPDIVVTEKGVADLASHFFTKAGITCLRRWRKTDNTRLAKACGGTIVSRPEEITEEDVGTGCGLFEVRKYGDEYFSFFEQCKEPKACTIMLRGGSKDVLNEMERNLQDAMLVARNVLLEPRLLPGGGATEMAISVALAEQARGMDGVEQWPFRAVGMAMEVIPRTIAQNCGSDVIRKVTELRARKAGKANPTLGINGNTGDLEDMASIGVWDPAAVKMQSLKTAMESACMLLRIDDIVSGIRNPADNGRPGVDQMLAQNSAAAGM